MSLESVRADHSHWYPDRPLCVEVHPRGKMGTGVDPDLILHPGSMRVSLFLRKEGKRPEGFEYLPWLRLIIRLHPEPDHGLPSVLPWDGCGHGPQCIPCFFPGLWQFIFNTGAGVILLRPVSEHAASQFRTLLAPPVPQSKGHSPTRPGKASFNSDLSYISDLTSCALLKRVRPSPSLRLFPRPGIFFPWTCNG